MLIEVVMRRSLLYRGEKWVRNLEGSIMKRAERVKPEKI